MLAALAAATVPLALAVPAHAHGGGSADLVDVKRATARFHNVDRAIAAGYQPTQQCVQHPTLGVMGYHYVNPSLVADGGEVDPTRPEVLVYQPAGKGGLRLVAVEYFVVEADSPNRVPRLGNVPFEGPMAGHDAHMPRHYDLHAWVWQHNPAGTFATWNPAGRC